MKHFLVTVLLLSFSTVVCSANQESADTSQAILTIEVTNGTANGSTVTNDEVTVQIYEHKQLLRTLNGKVAADGKIVFENVPTGDHIVALARARHTDMMFSGRAVVLKPTEKNIFAHVKVFDVSYDKSKLFIQIHHFFLKVSPEALEITEYLQLQNSSEMAVLSRETDDQNKPIVLEMMLPAQFKNLKAATYFEEDALVVTEKGFYDTMAVPPGKYDINFSYSLDISSDTMNIVKEITLPTSSFVVFAELGRAKLQGLGQTNQVTGSNGIPMEYYKYSGLTPAEKISFQIVGININTSDLTTPVVLGVVFGTIMLLVFLRLYRGKS
ncbi:MAG: hypothetical protein ACYS1A_01360 [Planctomycetota bacterium]|jgi:hypothetical protein